MNLEPAIVLPKSVADQIVSASTYGTLVARIDRAENMAVVIGFRPDSGDSTVDRTRPFNQRHHTSHIEPGLTGRCHAAEASLHILGIAAAGRDAELTFEAFREGLRGRVKQPAIESTPYLTYCLDDGDGRVPRWMAWWVTPGSARRGVVGIVDEALDPMSVLATAWPLEKLSDQRVAVAGVGSIGSHAAEALVRFGVGELVLWDPDRLWQHNLARHTAGADQIGRLKVNAVADALKTIRPTQRIVADPIDVVDDADQVREILVETSIVLVAVDGVAPRLAMNRMAAAARCEAIFAAVLEDGSVGEILRSQPGKGCLLCHRLHLQSSGHFDPEPEIDRGYGAGSAHRPMTAVGPDLALMGTLAAKTSVAVLLERKGVREQRLPGNHAAIGLRPTPSLPPPFAASGPGSVTWSVFEQSEQCPTCKLA